MTTIGGQSYYSSLHACFIGVTAFCCVFLRSDLAFGRVYFLPGDAFFHIEIDDAAVKALSEWKQGPMMMWYGPPASSAPALGISAGFVKCELNGCDADLVDRLIRIQNTVREQVGKRLGKRQKDNAQRDSVHCFIYDAKFEYRRFRLGLKYSERWKSSFKIDAFMSKGREARLSSLYKPFDESPEMIVEDWFNHDQCPQIPVTLPPDVEWELLGRPLKEAVGIDVDNVYFVVVAKSELARVIRRRKGAWFYEVSKVGQWIVRFDGEKWIRDELSEGKIIENADELPK
ncbi:MAG: hypothetical protein WCH39_09640 [Schlesneria sp.]